MTVRILGKKAALKLGIKKGVAHVIKPILPKSLRCPVCKVVEMPIETEEQADEMAAHVYECCMQFHPNRKSACGKCTNYKFPPPKEELKYTAKELKVHMLEEHGEDWGVEEAIMVDGETDGKS